MGVRAGRRDAALLCKKKEKKREEVMAAAGGVKMRLKSEEERKEIDRKKGQGLPADGQLCTQPATVKTNTHARAHAHKSTTSLFSTTPAVAEFPQAFTQSVLCASHHLANWTQSCCCRRPLVHNQQFTARVYSTSTLICTRHTHSHSQTDAYFQAFSHIGSLERSLKRGPLGGTPNTTDSALPCSVHSEGLVLKSK